ncbi:MULTISPECIES: hypothetical protein [Novosphingobium]|uniref:hypothetical protein n=1 Tax=Novosphingobium sp. RL4 TaxID=3109595 RepID=UPI001C8F46B5|nr:hypothetical protein [Novosphingobium sp. RL4]WRT95920.1 hypothetical protein U9J33_20185 [Novosphingobium sp. RL4]
MNKDANLTGIWMTCSRGDGNACSCHLALPARQARFSEFVYSGVHSVFMALSGCTPEALPKNKVEGKAPLAMSRAAAGLE